MIALGGDTGVGGTDATQDNITTFFATSEGVTITADGKPVVDRGRLLILDDPGLREYASRFGDPDELLSPARDKPAGEEGR